MENLFDDVLLAILSKMSHVELDKAACVCSRWYRLVNELRAHDPRRTALQLHTYVPSLVRPNQWKIGELQGELRRDVRHMMTRPAFGVYFMTGSFARHVMSLQEVRGKDPRLDQFGKWSHANKRNYDIGHINYDSFCLQALCDELARANTQSKSSTHSHDRLTPANCLFVHACGVSTPDGREFCDNEDREDEGILVYEPAAGALSLPAHMSQAYRVSTKQVRSSATLPTLRTSGDLAAWLGLGADERLRFLLILVEGMFFDEADVENTKHDSFFRSIDKVRLDAAAIGPHDTRNFAVAVGSVNRAICMTSDKVTPIERTHKYTVMAFAERQPGCVRVAQVRVDGDGLAAAVDEKLKQLEKTGIVCDVAAAAGDASYFAFKLTEYYTQANRADSLATDGDKELLQRALGVKSMPTVGFCTYTLYGHDYLPDYSVCEESKQTSTRAPLTPSERAKLAFFDEQLATTKVFTIIRLSKKF